MNILQGLMPTIWSGNWAPAIRKRLFKDGESSIEDLCQMMMESDGEYSSLLISDRILTAFENLDAESLVHFFHVLNEEYDLDAQKVEVLAREYAREQNAGTLSALTLASEPRRLELFRRLNLAPGGIRRLVKVREELQKLLEEHPSLKKVDADFRHLFSSWFNRGFLTLHPIEWETPAHILEKIIAYEAVHEIRNWGELRHRVEPIDRYCYGFFHPAMEDDPLVFVEVALSGSIPETIQEVLQADRPVIDPGTATCAVFYSISNCHAGLVGVSFGNFLIKQVATSLKRRFPNLKTFATISPAPGFRKWLVEESAAFPAIHGLIDRFENGSAQTVDEVAGRHLKQLAARYFLVQKNDHGQPLDPVARFHLKNGAKLERLNLLGDRSENGLRQSLGLMVNYVYDLQRVEQNHEKYMKDHKVVCSTQVRKLQG
ncbi:MAG: malonyl-CoA decarboxylase [Gammaproteobacteria bacterium]|nr:malonyl-CoA decarboxylase [Gammaproteobacteria bacterium]